MFTLSLTMGLPFAQRLNINVSRYTQKVSSLHAVKGSMLLKGNYKRHTSWLQMKDMCTQRRPSHISEISQVKRLISKALVPEENNGRTVYLIRRDNYAEFLKGHCVMWVPFWEIVEIRLGCCTWPRTTILLFKVSLQYNGYEYDISFLSFILRIVI